MAIDKEEVEKAERKYKEKFFGRIRRIGSEQTEAISLIAENARIIGLSNVNIPNAGITLNNKLIELSREFKRAGISMFSSEYKDYDVAASSFLGDAIIYDLIDQLSNSSEKLGEYSQAIGNVSKKRNKQIQALQDVSPLRKFFSKIRSFFVPVKPIDFSLTEEEQNTIDTPLQEYIDIDNKIENYNLEENLVPALVKEIAGPAKYGQFETPHLYDANAVPGLLEESVIPDLKKLGLEHLIPQLQEALIEEYKKDLPDPKINPVSQEDMHSYVPDFNRESKQGTKVTVLDDKSKRTLKGLAQIYVTVSPSDRQATTKVIQGELNPYQENKKEETSKTTDNSDISLE